MEEIDDKFPLFEMLKIPWICLISQNKNTDSFLFSPKQQLFLNCWEKKWKFHQNLMILSKMQSYQDIFFLWKKIKTLFRNRICHKILKFSSKIRQIRDLQRRTTSKNQCECFFRFFRFSKKYLYSKVFWIFFFIKSKKYTKKYVKLFKITKIQALWTCLERLIQARINLMVF